MTDKLTCYLLFRKFIREVNIIICLLIFLCEQTSSITVVCQFSLESHVIVCISAIFTEHILT